MSGVALGDRSSSVMSEIDVMHEGMGDDGCLLYQCVGSKFLLTNTSLPFFRQYIFITPLHISDLCK